MPTMKVDTLIFGGGAAGLWLLDELRRRGYSAILLESGRLGQGQTIASQGIIHGGLKYTLQGLLTASAAEIREMPGIWRDCLSGHREPDLSAARVRSSCCYLWRTDSVRSRLGMIGARIGLRVAPNELSPEQRPDLLQNCPGTVAQLDEQVISPAGFIAALADRNEAAILQVDVKEGLSFQLEAPGEVETVAIGNPTGDETIEFQPSRLIFTAGGGNADLRTCVGLNATAMQRRPLHMVMVRGNLPALNGHCVDGARTRVTVTSDKDTAGRTVWQVGGQVAEEGVEFDPTRLIEHTAAELRDVLPGLDLQDAEFATYRVDRAEAVTRNGRRPEQAQTLQEGNVTTAWPTKLALVPQLVNTIVDSLGPAQNPQPTIPGNWSRPQVAQPPWETCADWARFDSQTFKIADAA